MITIKDLARELGISYEAVRQQVKRYENRELDGHVYATGKVQYLDDFAIEFLKAKRSTSPVVVVQLDKEETIKVLEDENKALLQKIALLQEDLLKHKDVQMQLQGELNEQKLLAAKTVEAEQRTAAAEQKAAEAEKQAISARQKSIEAEVALEDARERLQTAEDVAQMNAQEAQEAKAQVAVLNSEIEALVEKMDAMKRRSLWQRILNKD